MRKLIISELIGKKFNNLTILHQSETIRFKSGTKIKVSCKCDCGNVKDYTVQSVIHGYTKSCGCLAIKVLINRNYKHYLCKHPLYRVWKGIKGRCYNKNSKAYKDYGRRGIIMCNEWLNNFEAFHAWAINNGWKQGLHIDRELVNGNYEPGNCRWVTQIVNNGNRRNVRYVVYNNENIKIIDLAKSLNIDRKSLHRRIFMCNWPVDKALKAAGISI